MPTFDVQSSHYAKAVGVGVGVALGGGILWVIFNAIFAGFGILSAVLAIGVGWAAGDLISKSVNAKRGTGLAWIGAGSVIGAYVISLPSSPTSGFLFSIIAVGIGIYLAVQRLR